MTVSLLSSAYYYFLFRVCSSCRRVLLPFPSVLSATSKILLTTRTNSVKIRKKLSLVMFLLRNTQLQSQTLRHSIRGSSVHSGVKSPRRPHPATVHCLQLHTKIAESGGDAEYTQTTTEGANTITRTPPKNSRVVICGGGIMGASVAYHLALAGWGPHTVIIEQGR